MLQTTRRYLRAAGSILDLVPVTDYSKLISKKSDAENMADDIQAIGDDLRASAQDYARENGIIRPKHAIARG
ncbi:hypothetical protein [Serratia fonticola]